MRQIADYQLAELIGVGNHGRFFKATPPERLERDDTWVAVKILDRHASPDEFRRFANELRLFAAVSSEHLASPIDAGQQDGLLFYVIPYYPEGSLNSKSDSKVPESVAIRAVADAARGAHALHEVGVAHRDIKPSNILLDRGRGRLADLGLAQVLNPGMTITGSGPIGSLECMSPGRVLGQPATRATEIWELAATLHKALTDRSVMGDIPDHDILAALRHVTTAQPTIDETLPADIRSLIERCMSDDPNIRPATASDMADLLEELSL